MDAALDRRHHPARPRRQRPHHQHDRIAKRDPDLDPTATASPTATATRSRTPTRTRTATATPSPTPTRTLTPVAVPLSTVWWDRSRTDSRWGRPRQGLRRTASCPDRVGHRYGTRLARSQHQPGERQGWRRHRVRPGQQPPLRRQLLYGQREPGGGGVCARISPSFRRAGDPMAWRSIRPPASSTRRTSAATRSRCWMATQGRCWPRCRAAAGRPSSRSTAPRAVLRHEPPRSDDRCLRFGQRRAAQDAAHGRRSLRHRARSGGRPPLHG